MVVEGMNALPAALELAEKYQVEMPIVQTVDAIVNHGMRPDGPRPEKRAAAAVSCKIKEAFVMPSTYAHRRFGADVLERLPAELQEKIAPYRELYDIGLHGPDLLFYYHAANLPR